MGSEIKKQPQGRRRRRNVPDVIIPERCDDEYLSQTALCPCCTERVPVRDIAGTYLDRKCPNCGGALTEDVYDFAAQDALVNLHAAEEALRDCEGRVKDFEEKISRYRHFWQFAFRLIARKRLRQAEHEIAAKRLHVSEAAKVTSALAYGRYYCGEWFLRTHISLCSEDDRHTEPYRIQPRYSLDGAGVRFYLKQIKRSSDSRGILGEFEAFEFFRKQVVDPASPLFGAQLLPNLYVPNTGHDSNHSNSPWTQIDLAIATKSCVFVVEVKRRYADIYAAEPYEELLIGRRDADGNESLNRSVDELSQNSRHAVEFSKACPTYDFDRVYELLLLVGTRSFTSGGSSFVDNVYIGGLAGGGAQLLDAMLEACSSEHETLSDDELKTLGDNLVNRYGDLRQKLRAMHVRWIESQQCHH